MDLLPLPPFSSIGKSLESTCRKAIYDFSMLEGIDSLTVALSGGKDSLTMLFLLNAILGRGFQKIPLHAIFIESEFSCGAGVSKKFLKDICDKLDINFIARKVDITSDADCYTCSRIRRNTIFAIMKEIGSSTVAFGHHKDDNAETLLMNLLQKGEFAGLLPKIRMIHYGITIIRPLIYIEEKDILEFAKKYGFQRSMCQCPKGSNSKRKKSKEIIKLMEEDFTFAKHNLSNAALNYGSKKALVP